MSLCSTNEEMKVYVGSHESTLGVLSTTDYISLATSGRVLDKNVPIEQVNLLKVES